MDASGQLEYNCGKIDNETCAGTLGDETCPETLEKLDEILDTETRTGAFVNETKNFAKERPMAPPPPRFFLKTDVSVDLKPNAGQIDSGHLEPKNSTADAGNSEEQQPANGTPLADTETSEMDASESILQPGNSDSIIMAKAGLVPPYTVPEWSGKPSVEYKLEIVKDGAVISHLELSKKGAYMFGRSDRCDFMLEHPTVSRYHAVLQFRADNETFLFDLNSTHGSFINKRKIKSHVYAPVKVGDILKFGQSSRLYVFQGPAELMPEEGLSRAERLMLRTAEAALQRKTASESAMRAAHSKRGSGGREEEGVMWGMGEDAEEEVGPGELDPSELSYDTYKGRLTEGQEKLMEKLTKKQDKMGNLQREIDAIRAKEMSQGGLSEGQQSQISRNEQRMEQLMDEVESLEETLNDSIKEMVGAKTAGKGGKNKRKKGSIFADDDSSQGDSDDDEFFDRAGARKKKRAAALARKVETAESLLDQRLELTLQLEELRTKLELEEKRKVQAAESKSGKMMEEGKSDDPLDQFMSNVSSEIEKDQTGDIQKNIGEVQASMDRVARLLKVADPTGQEEKKWKPKERKKQVSKQKVSQAEKTSAAVAIPADVAPSPQQTVDGSKEASTKAVGKDEVDSSLQNVHGTDSVLLGNTLVGTSDSSLLSSDSKTAAADNVSGSDSSFIGYKKMKADVKQAEQERRKETDDASQEVAAQSNADEAVALLLRHAKGESQQINSFGDSDAVGGEKKGGKEKKKRKFGPARPPHLVNEKEIGEVETWLPPAGQTGDGRTSLNEKLGY